MTDFDKQLLTFMSEREIADTKRAFAVDYEKLAKPDVEAAMRIAMEVLGKRINGVPAWGILAAQKWPEDNVVIDHIADIRGEQKSIHSYKRDINAAAILAKQIGDMKGCNELYKTLLTLEGYLVVKPKDTKIDDSKLAELAAMIVTD